MAKIWKERDLKVLKFTWDFSVNGGAVGAIELGSLPENYVITKGTYVVKTAPVGGGTIVIGQTGGDTDGFNTDMDAYAVNAVGNLKGALIWDSTDKHMIPYYTNSNQLVSILVATTAYTAGKIEFYFEGYQA